MRKSLLKTLVIIFWLCAVAFILVSLFDLPLGFNFPQNLSDLFKKDKYSDVKKQLVTTEILEESTTISVVEKVSPAVVSIVVKTIDFDLFSGPSLSEAGIGTGFIVDSSGLIVTNSHVVDNARGEYSVVLKDGSTYEVEQIHLDPATDLAILEIIGRDLPIVELGDSDSLKVGQTAIAIGNALGMYQNTVSVGVVSGVSRQVSAGGGFSNRATLTENAIQTDAALNPGNSGGPLLNSAGQVIGINFATTFGADNVSFALPINSLKPLLEIFLKEGKIVRPYIGISYTIITKEIAALRRLPEGAFVSRVLVDSPADKAGIQRGDIITKFDGEQIGSTLSIASAVAKKRIGDKVDIEVDRGGETIALEVTLEESPETF